MCFCMCLSITAREAMAGLALSCASFERLRGAVAVPHTCSITLSDMCDVLLAHAMNRIAADACY